MPALTWGDVPAALVEDVKGSPAGVEFMDYVATGKVIKLAPRETIVLSYLQSCWRETITGGTVVVGVDQSEVRDGKIERTHVKCSGGRMQLSSEQAVQSAGVISRKLAEPSARQARPDPQVILHSRLPVIDVGGTGTLVIERLDGPAERYAVEVGPRELMGRSFYDFAKSRRLLAAGGVYRARFRTKQVVFKVDRAAPAAAPMLARLLRFE
jgi:hypothetical protein